MTIYFGDIHNHCGITYGFGSLENAITAAKEQLDFCAVTGHAMWPDIPKRTEKLAFLIDFHQEGFKRLNENWDQIRKTIKENNVPNEFVTFQSYEMHSRKFGDHHVLSTDDDLPLIYSKDPSSLYEDLHNYNRIIIPHHIAYTPGYRGINWDYFDQIKSPVVEVISKHGCSMSDKSSYNYYHTMGPRDYRNTVFEGLKRGHQFSFVGSTDHHAGYPGSYGDGRIAVSAKNKTRNDIFKAINDGHTYAITGDKIICDFSINNSLFGSSIQSSSKRDIHLHVKACDFIEKIILYKNLIPLKTLYYEQFLNKKPTYKKFKLRVEYGWGKSITGYDWDGKVTINDGEIIDVEPHFRGRSVLAPTKDMKKNDHINHINNKVLYKDENTVSFCSNTVKNPSPLHPLTNAISLEVIGDLSSSINITMNSKKVSVKFSDLIKGVHSYHIDSYNSEAFTLTLIPEYYYTYDVDLSDTATNENDFYHVEIKQINGQMAWISPIYVRS